MLAWHFLQKDKHLGFSDGRLVEVGVPLECEGDPVLCENGMHGSVRLIDALKYARGPVVCRVEIEGDIVEGDDKLCGRRRTVLWWLDATRILHEFACSCADDALALVEEHDLRSVAGIDAKRKWLAGEITDDELDAASEAAWAAALADASEAAMAASAAARSAAWASADGATWWAAWAAADADARWAAISKQDARLTDMVMAAHEADAVALATACDTESSRHGGREPGPHNNGGLSHDAD